jgi:hypothetical protein
MRPRIPTAETVLGGSVLKSHVSIASLRSGTVGLQRHHRAQGSGQLAEITSPLVLVRVCTGLVSKVVYHGCRICGELVEGIAAQGGKGASCSEKMKLHRAGKWVAKVIQSQHVQTSPKSTRSQINGAPSGSLHLGQRSEQRKHSGNQLGLREELTWKNGCFLGSCNFDTYTRAIDRGGWCGSTWLQVSGRRIACR